MEEIECTWVGPTGINPLAGKVYLGRKLKLSEKKFRVLKGLKLVKEKEQTKPKRKEA